MSLVKTMGRYCFIKCDGPDCTRKIEHIDPDQVMQLAAMCNWERRGDQWVCPDCAVRLSKKMPPGKGQGRSGPRRQRPSVTR